MSKPLIFYRFALAQDVLSEMENNPKEFLYGADQLIKDGKVDTLFVSKGKRDTLLRKFLYLVEKPVAMTLYLGMPLEIVLENWTKVKKASVIFCINDAISFAVLFFKWIGLLKVPAITLLQSTSERHRKYFKDNKIAKWFVRNLLLRSELILTLSDSAKRELIREFGIEEDKIKVFYFGVDDKFWVPTSADREEYILSVGNDHNRDFETLIKGLEGKYKLKLVTRLTIPQSENIEVLNGVSNEALRTLYQKAKIVVTPSKEIKTESSGLSSSLQAMACATPVLISNSESMAECFKEDVEMFFYKAEDSDSLKLKVEEVLSTKELLTRTSSASRSIVEKKYNNVQMGNSLKLHLSKFDASII